MENSMEIVKNTESVDTVNERIAKNLIRYRKEASLTQVELAALINYSDKSVSKWESGNGVPDVYILLKLAELYHVSVNDLVYGEEEKGKADPAEGEALETGDAVANGAKSGEAGKKGRNLLPFWMQTLIMLLSSGLVWLIAVVAFVTLNLIYPKQPWWLAFIYALPVNSILILVLSGVWKKTFLNFASISALIWTSLLSVYLTVRLWMDSLSIAGAENIWLVFLLGIPLETLEIFWTFFRRVKSATKKRKKQEAEAQKAMEVETAITAGKKTEEESEKTNG